MARPVVLSNGSMFVGLDESGLVHDFYYPYVGLENLTTSRIPHHKIGVFVDGSFSWLDDGQWQLNVNFQSDALVSEISASHEELGLNITLHDFVDTQYNAFCRSIEIANNSDRTREVRVFMHQVFQVSRGGRADTALYEPDLHYILDYKGRCSILAYGQFADGTSFDEYSIGNYGIEGKEGTFKDAEDGSLSNNPVEHGGVDSVMGFYRFFKPHESHVLNYWLVAADSQSTVERIHKTILSDGLAARLEMTRDYWRNWLGIASNQLNELFDAEQVTRINKSLMVIKAHTDRRGGVIASADSSIYNYGRDYYSYVWPRDGAYALWPLIQLGYIDEPKRFFEFCRDILTNDGYLMHKYQPDRAIGSSWHPLVHGKRAELAIQEDETAIVLVVLKEFLDHNPAQEEFVRNLYGTLIQPAANFMEGFFDSHTGLPHPSYDLWEQEFLTSTYTVATVYRALLKAAELADRFEYPDDALRWQNAADMITQNLDKLHGSDNVYYRGIRLNADDSVTEQTLDISSLYGPVFFGLPLKDVNQTTFRAVEKQLLNSVPAGGVPRYLHDDYFLKDKRFVGNPWHVASLWLAQCYLLEANLDAAQALLTWVEARALPSGMLAEQVDPEDGSPVGVTPLVWSHAEYIRTVLQLANARRSD